MKHEHEDTNYIVSILILCGLLALVFYVTAPSVDNDYTNLPAASRAANERE